MLGRGPSVDMGATVPPGARDAAAAWAWQERETMVLVPAHFPAEVANALLRGHRFGTSDVIRTLQRLFDTGVEIVDRGTGGLSDAVALAEEHLLSVYDALYLQLALDVDAGIATLYSDLAAAARLEDVTVVE